MGKPSLVSIVDDSESVRESLPDLLKQVGFEVRAFSSAEEFLTSEAANGTSCLILDVGLPGMSGPDLHQELIRLLAYQPPCKAIATIRRDGTAFVRSGATDIGPGPYTVMTMLAADCLGVPIERVRFGLADSAMPKAPQEGGSGLTGALGNAVHATCVGLVRAFVDLVSHDQKSPLRGCRLEGITVRDGGIQITEDSARFETYANILRRHGLEEVTVEGESAPPGETASGTMIVQDGRFIPYTRRQPVPVRTRADMPRISSRFTSIQTSERSGSLESCRPLMVAGFSTRKRRAVRLSVVSPWESEWRSWRRRCRIVPDAW